MMQPLRPLMQTQQLQLQQQMLPPVVPPVT